jgi:hypothetical protein
MVPTNLDIQLAKHRRLLGVVLTLKTRQNINHVYISTYEYWPNIRVIMQKKNFFSNGVFDSSYDILHSPIPTIYLFTY